MELGERLKRARLEAGLSQRQLCGDTITRNMLSQIENGSARPSMDTLRILAGRLGKSVSFFLDEEAVLSPNQAVMTRARRAWAEKRPEEVLAALADYRTPDEIFDREKRLLEQLAALELARQAQSDGRSLYAGQLLDEMEISEGDYCAEDLKRRRLMLLAGSFPQRRREICSALPSIDDQLLLRARDALDRGDFQRSAALLDAAEKQDCADWNFLRGEVYLAQERFLDAARCYHRAEEAYPEKTAPRLEHCYRELEDYRQAYFYACRQR